MNRVLIDKRKVEVFGHFFHIFMSVEKCRKFSSVKSVMYKLPGERPKSIDQIAKELLTSSKTRV